MLNEKKMHILSINSVKKTERYIVCVRNLCQGHLAPMNSQKKTHHINPIDAKCLQNMFQKSLIFLFSFLTEMLIHF